MSNRVFFYNLKQTILARSDILVTLQIELIENITNCYTVEIKKIIKECSVQVSFVFVSESQKKRKKRKLLEQFRINIFATDLHDVTAVPTWGILSKIGLRVSIYPKFFSNLELGTTRENNRNLGNPSSDSELGTLQSEPGIPMETLKMVEYLGICSFSG